MSQVTHPYRQKLANSAEDPQRTHYSHNPSRSLQLGPYSERSTHGDLSTTSTTPNAYHSAHTGTSSANKNSPNQYSYGGSQTDVYVTPSEGTGLPPPSGPTSLKKRQHQQQFQATYNNLQPPSSFSSAPGSNIGSSESLPYPHAISGVSSRGSSAASSRLQPPDTPVGARSFSSPSQMQDEPNKPHQASKSEPPVSGGTDQNAPSTGRSHHRQSKSVDLSHMYLLDRNESAHFTLTNENLSDVSHNLIKQYLGENSSSSLLPRMKTIEMYRKNVKKSNDPKVLFQYAQYMLQTALTMDQSKSTEGSPDPNAGPTLEKNMKKQFLKEAVHYLKKLSDKGYTDAQYLLADAYSSGALGKVENKEAFALFQGAAKHGHVESAYRTAYCYEEGLGVGRDSRRAIEFLKYAASKNHPAAMYKLGVYSFHSRMGLPDNVNVKKSGIQWLSRAATSANELTNAAPYELAKIYENGFLDIVIPDHKYAMELYVQSASLGHVKSAAILGKAYEIGDEVVPQDADLSIHYYTQAAVAGDPESMLSLCAWYLMGNPPNLEKDNFEAFQWAIRAAKLGLPKAQSTVGHFYEKGIGCDVNLESAKYWYTLATENGDQRAKSKMLKLSNPNQNYSSSVASNPELSTRPSSSSALASANSTPLDTKKEGKNKKEKKKKKGKEKGGKEKDCIIM
ncbi:CYFA0S04e05996g1_1 [Cyberlindnera fabianii]|uniref:CYFA0S04e05996g1_1 n=1 Tax=Cyberlindnera fabianii TaxID=36022 RepID=A0A061AXS9_CYBFA|nr:CYFA0S04e05996g1_1 [Cyberlindnera fabianii]